MEFIPKAKKIFKAALDQNWEVVEEQCPQLLTLTDERKSFSDWASKIRKELNFNDLMPLMCPLSEENDNIIHFLVHGKKDHKRDDLLKKIVDLLRSADNENYFLRQQNDDGNTVLHEACISGNLNAVKLLFEKDGFLVKMTNNKGETPLFRAAAFGKTKVVRCLARERGCREDIHRKRTDGNSILFAAVRGKHFGTALEVLKLFGGISQSEDVKKSSLHMLAKIPSAFNSEQKMGIWEEFLHFFLPVGYGHDDDADNVVTRRKPEDHTKSGSPRKGPSVSSDDNPASCKDEEKKKSCLDKVLLTIYATYLLIWKLIIQGCGPAKRIWKEKRDNKLAYKLASKLIQESLTWEHSIMRLGGKAPDLAEEKQKIPLFAATKKANAEAVEYLLELYPEALDPNNHRKPREKQQREEKGQKIPLFATTRTKQAGCVKSSLDFYADALDQLPLFNPKKTGNSEFIKFLVELYPLALEQINHRKSPEADMEEEEECRDEEEWNSPLLAAIRARNVEFVELIIDEYPQALSQSDNRKQNILHLAAAYRQKKIFDLVKKKEVLMIRLARQIDVADCTVLHCVADTKHYIGGTGAGPAYRLNEELEWFKRVEEIVPAYYTMRRNKNKETPFEVFEKKHKELHKEAQQWMKDTSQSCSAVAVLVATVVFAAAFTVPGGTDRGQPILIHSPFFLFFTVMDVIALSCSLTAVVIFLSILTSPFGLDDFYSSLLRKLTLGFALLFMSVATTMLTFASTIFLVIRVHDRRAWTTTLICSASFFPVSVLALTHFPLFVSFITSWMNLFKFIRNAPLCDSAIDRLKSTTIYKKVIRFLKSHRNKCRNYLEKLISDDETGNAGDGHSGLNQKSSSNLDPEETPSVSGLCQGSSSNVPPQENPDPNVQE